MRLSGTLKGHKVNILIDSSPTHSFLHPSLVKFTQGVADSASSLKVYVADGSQMFSKGKVNQVLLKIQEYNCATDFFLLPVMGCDVVLGAEWLESLGPIL